MPAAGSAAARIAIDVLPKVALVIAKALVLDEALASFVDENVGNDRRARRSGPAAGSQVPCLQLLELLPARRCGDEGLQLLLPLLKRPDRRHGRSFFAQVLRR